jgi:hypothetical protein
MAGKPTDLPSDARSILLALSADGSTMGNGRLRDTVGLEPVPPLVPTRSTPGQLSQILVVVVQYLVGS